MAADVVGQDGVAVADEVGLGQDVHAEPVAAEAVEHDHAGPPGGRLRAVREVQRRAELHAVVHRHLCVLLGEGVGVCGEGQREHGDERETHAGKR